MNSMRRRMQVAVSDGFGPYYAVFGSPGNPKTTKPTKKGTLRAEKKGVTHDTLVGRRDPSSTVFEIFALFTWIVL